MLRDIIGKNTDCMRVYSSIRGVQSCLYFGATQQSRSYQRMIGCRPLSSADKTAEHLSLKRTSLIRPFTTLLHCACASHVHLNLHPLYPLFTAVRCRRRKMNRKSDQQQDQSAEDEGEDTDEEEADDETDVSSIAFPEDALLTSNYREMITHVKSTRLDAVVSAGLGLARSKVEELFLESQLRLNGERLHKKSEQLDEGDYVDYVFTSEDGSTKLKRVRVVKIEHSGGPEKQKVHLRVWRNPQDPP